MIQFHFHINGRLQVTPTPGTRRIFSPGNGAVMAQTADSLGAGPLVAAMRMTVEKWVGTTHGRMLIEPSDRSLFNVAGRRTVGRAVAATACVLA